jgi:hypothetical protein
MECLKYAISSYAWTVKAHAECMELLLRREMLEKGIK